MMKLKMRQDEHRHYASLFLSQASSDSCRLPSGSEPSADDLVKSLVVPEPRPDDIDKAVRLEIA